MSRIEYHFLTFTNSTHAPLTFLLVLLLVALVALFCKLASQPEISVSGGIAPPLTSN
jgi:hypothetical protein